MATWNTAQSIVGTSPGRPATDFYPTPPEVTDALLRVESFPEWILEPACGNGAISRILKDNGHYVISSDLHNYGWDDADYGIDFLGVAGVAGIARDDFAIVTNPPFSLVYEFIEKAVSLRPQKIAFLAKLSLLEGQKRSRLLESTPLKNVWVFRRRIQMTRNGEEPRGGGMIAFAWFVWEDGYTGRPMIGWV
jgi:hypothetical protein